MRWPARSSRTRSCSRPWEAVMRVVASLSSESVMAVCSSRRSAVAPSDSSARALRSVQRRSPVVIGRLGPSSNQSLSPAGEKLTAPCWSFRRPTRPGGSCWASAGSPASSHARASSQRAARPERRGVRCIIEGFFRLFAINARQRIRDGIRFAKQRNISPPKATACKPSLRPAAGRARLLRTRRRWRWPSGGSGRSAASRRSHPAPRGRCRSRARCRPTRRGRRRAAATAPPPPGRARPDARGG